MKKVIVVGGGPAGLMAADVLCSAGVSVDVYDAMPSVGRKFLLAGKGGLNLTHSEPLERFLARYGAAQRVIDQRLITALAGQGLEVFDNRRIQHDVDPLLARLGADSRLPFRLAGLLPGDFEFCPVEIGLRQAGGFVRSTRHYSRRGLFHRFLPFAWK